MPLTAVMMSPGRTPCWAAGELGQTERMKSGGCASGKVGTTPPEAEVTIPNP
jgi:hypothetical protein